MRKYIQSLLDRKAKSEESGTSLIQLIIVVIILGILTAIGILAYNSVDERTEDNVIKAEAEVAVAAVAAQISNGENLAGQPLSDTVNVTLPISAEYNYRLDPTTPTSVSEFTVTVTRINNANHIATAGPGEAAKVSHDGGQTWND